MYVCVFLCMRAHLSIIDNFGVQDLDAVLGCNDPEQALNKQVCFECAHVCVCVFMCAHSYRSWEI